MEDGSTLQESAGFELKEEDSSGSRAQDASAFPSTNKKGGRKDREPGTVEGRKHGPVYEE